jgi:hypothetical protein
MGAESHAFVRKGGGMRPPGPVVKHVSDALKAVTIELRDELLAEGNIEPQRPRVNGILGYIDKSRVSADERDAIAAFLATKKPTQCPANDSGDDFNLCVFLRSRGHKVQRHCSTWGRRAPFWIDGKPYSRRGFIAFVNAIRAELELLPLGCAA